MFVNFASTFTLSSKSSGRNCSVQDIIILYDHNTYFFSSPICQTCLIDLYRKMTEQFRPELFDDSVNVDAKFHC
jgi:hypothetical protein